MSQLTVFEKPRWLRDLARFLPLKSQFVLSGNVRDLQIIETSPGIIPFACEHENLSQQFYGDRISRFGIGCRP